MLKTNLYIPALCGVPDCSGSPQGPEDKRAMSFLRKKTCPLKFPESQNGFFQLLKYSDKFGGNKTPACMTYLGLDKSTGFDDYGECELIILEGNV